MTDPDQAANFSARASNSGPPESLWAADEFAGDEEYPATDRSTAFTSLRFIRAALKRSGWLLCAFALAGMLIGYELYAKFPPAYSATTSILLTNSKQLDAGQQIQTNVVLAQSQAVAGNAMSQLGLHQSASSFIPSYSVTFVPNDVLVITAAAQSSNDAVRRASALATAFLQVRTQMLQAQQKQQATSLNQQISQAQQRLDSINSEISRVAAQPTSPTQQAELSKLRLEGNYANTTLTTTLQNASQTLAATQVNTTAMIQGSEVLNAATPIPRSHKKSIVFFAIEGLIAALAVGLVIVVVRALVSDRLRFRGDVAEAIGAPVMLSVGSLNRRQWLPHLGRRTTGQALSMRRVVTHLHGAVPRSSRGPGRLAVVAVDDSHVIARAVVSLAVSCASQGMRVVVADLSEGARAARLLRAKGPGVHDVDQDGVGLVVAVPDRDDVAPIGPLRASVARAEPGPADEALVDAYASADLLLTLATLNPAFGADYLATWATNVVAVVTAGHSSEVRVHAAGEMIRHAGMHLTSVVLIGADKSDESVGMAYSPDDPAPIRSI
jgi:capsular polysaccharide biosynthesis protein